MFRRGHESRPAGAGRAGRTGFKLLLALLVVVAPLVTAQVARANSNSLTCMINPCTNVAGWEMYRLKSVWDNTDVAITVHFNRHELQSQIDGGYWTAKGSNGGMECFWEVVNECEVCEVNWRDYAVLYETSLQRWYYIEATIPTVNTP